MDLAQYADGGLLAPKKIAEAFRTTQEEIARSAGLDKDAIQRKERACSDKTQRRLREMVEVVNKVEPRFGSTLIAYAWYRSKPLPGFSGRTAMQLVKEGRGQRGARLHRCCGCGSLRLSTKGTTFSGRLYRALNPIYAREPLSGRGADTNGR